MKWEYKIVSVYAVETLFLNDEEKLNRCGNEELEAVGVWADSFHRKPGPLEAPKMKVAHCQLPDCF
jgi:hypothetical protein